MSLKNARPQTFWLFLVLSFLTLISALTLLYFHYGTSPLAFESAPKKTVELSANRLPVQLEIKRLGINLLVETQEVKASVWPESDKAVTFVKGTAIPGQDGNSIFYGHNWTSLLGRLPLAKIGDEVTVTLSNGVTKSFVITKTKIVSPNDTEVLDNTSFSRLTLYTCTGFLDSKRFVAFAQPKI